MVITQLKNGLGNQMFQYALGRRISHINRVPLKLDINEFNVNIKGINVRNFALHIFNIEENFPSQKEINRLIPKKRVMRILAGITDKMLPFYRKTYIIEKFHHFDPEILKLKDNIYLEGYWQSEKYFQDIKEVIKRDFTFKKPPEGKNRELLNTIKDTNSIGVHVRRGDYISNKRLVLCSADYYKKCINKITDLIANPHFFIFSDEPEWVKKNINPDFPVTVIDHNGPKMDYEDFRLLSGCRHFIIANSTFSWWAAWLGDYPEKLVFAPGKWFKINKNTKDLYPDSWIKV